MVNKPLASAFAGVLLVESLLRPLVRHEIGDLVHNEVTDHIPVAFRDVAEYVSSGSIAPPQHLYRAPDVADAVIRPTYLVEYDL
jgi:hypothetical protein